MSKRCENQNHHHQSVAILAHVAAGRQFHSGLSQGGLRLICVKLSQKRLRYVCVCFCCMGWTWNDEGDGWKSKQRRTRKPRGERGGAASRTQQSVSASAERERGTSWKPSDGLDPMHFALLSGVCVQRQDHQRALLLVMWSGFRQERNGKTPSQAGAPGTLGPELPAVGDIQTAPRLEEIAAQETLDPSRLLKAWNASKNAVAQKTNQHAAPVAKVARWTA